MAKRRFAWRGVDRKGALGVRRERDQRRERERERGEHAHSSRSGMSISYFLSRR